MVDQNTIDKMGGDWGLFGEAPGPKIVEMLNNGQISIVFCNNGLAIGVKRDDGAEGTYNIKHTDLADF